VKKCGTVIPKKGLVPISPHNKPGTVSPGVVGPGKSPNTSALSPLKARIDAYLSCLKEHGVTSPARPGSTSNVTKAQYKEATQACRALLFKSKG
jgi:hypothetical protein